MLKNLHENEQGIFSILKSFIIAGIFAAVYTALAVKVPGNEFINEAIQSVDKMLEIGITIMSILFGEWMEIWLSIAAGWIGFRIVWAAGWFVFRRTTSA